MPERPASLDEQIGQGLVKFEARYTKGGTGELKYGRRSSVQEEFYRAGRAGSYFVEVG